MCVEIFEVWCSSSQKMEAPSKDQLPQATTTTTRHSILGRKMNISMAMPTLLTLYFLGACIAFMVCTRTFISFHIFSPEESQPPVQLPGQEELPSESALEILEEQMQSPTHTLRDVRSIADSWKYSAVGSFGEVEDHDDGEPEFMQQPVLRMNSANKAADLEARYCQ